MQGVIIQIGQDDTLPQPASAAAPPQRRRRRVSVGIGEAAGVEPLGGSGEDSRG